jgi:EmrB/QacA subfamily drug resistance transporter
LFDVGIKRAALTVATLSAFMTPFMGSAVNIALPSIAGDFQIDALLLSWIATSYLLASAVFLVPFGRLADIHGRKRVFAWGILVFTLSSLLCALSSSASFLIASRIIQGAGSAMIFATGMAILTSVFPPHERGRVLGINVAAVYTGLSLGPVLGGFLTQHVTWRSVFLFNLPLGAAILFLVVWKVDREWAEAKGEAFDWAGALIYMAGIIGIMYGISLVPARTSLLPVLLGILALSGFVLFEAKAKHPVFPISLFSSNRVFTFSSLAALIHYSATFAVTFLLSLYLQNIKGYGPQQAGLVLIFQPLVMAAFSPLAGRLSDRIEPRIVSSAGMGLTTVGLLVLTFLQQDSTTLFIVSVLMLLGLGFALFSSPNMNAIMGSVEKKFYGIASGAVGTMRLLGMMTSMGIATVIFALFLGRVQISPANYPLFMQALKAAFLIFSGLCLGGTFASLVRGKLHQG